MNAPTLISWNVFRDINRCIYQSQFVVRITTKDVGGNVGPTLTCHYKSL